MLYTCERCDYQTDIRTHFLKHLHRKTICPALKADVPIEKMLGSLHENSSGSHKHECPSCLRQYSSRSALSYHRERCQSHMIVDRIMNLENMLKIQAMQHNIQLKNNTGTSQVVCGNNNTITQQIHIHVQPFGQEITEDVTREFRTQCIRDGITGVIRMLDFIFFNNEKPENHNVKIRSLKNLLVDVFRDPHWETRSFHETVEMMIHKCTTEITKDIDIATTIRNQDRYDEFQAVYNLPRSNIKKAKEHVRAKLVARKEGQLLQ